MDAKQPRQSNTALHDSRTAAISVLVFRFGGVSGAVRKIVFGWPGRFSYVQISIALQRRWPLLKPNQYQVSDCLEAMERQRLIECVLCRHTKIYQRITQSHENHHHKTIRSLGR